LHPVDENDAMTLTRGSLSFLLIAKVEGRIPLVRPLIEELRASGMHLSEDLVRRVLSLAGE
jgi:predicted nucleic acid-binding protein